MTVELSPHYPDPLPPDVVQRLVAAAQATPGVNAPREALAVAFAYLAEPVDSVVEEDSQGVEVIRAARLTRLANGSLLTLNVKLFGCAGNTWERNERHNDEWSSPADPAPAASSWRLPPVGSWRGPGGEATAALSVELDSTEQVGAVVNRSARLLGRDEGQRGYNLPADIRVNGQEQPCLLVAQVYRTPDGDFWGWPAVRGNNRTKGRHEILNCDQVALLTAPDVTTALREWVARQKIALSHDAPGGEEYHALRVAAVDTHLAVGCTLPELLYQTVQALNRRDHLHAELPFPTINQDRAVGRRLLEDYRTAGVIDEQLFLVLVGDEPVTRLPHVDPDTSVSEQRALRSRLLLTQFFPNADDHRRRLLLRQAMGEGAVIDKHAVVERLRAYSALCSMSWPEAWNPRVDDGTVTVNAARSGVVLSGRGVHQLLAAAHSDDGAFDELVRYIAPQWLAAFKLADPDRGSMGAQASRGDDGELQQRARRSISDVLASLNNPRSRLRTVKLLRELATAMDEGRKPRRVFGSGEADLSVEVADRAWFDRAFPQGSGKRLSPPQHTPSPMASPDPRAVSQLQFELVKARSAGDREQAETKKAYIRKILNDCEQGATEVTRAVADARSHAKAAGIYPVWDREEVERLIGRVDGIYQRLRSAVEGTRPTEDES
ncbi:hypothetical protein [Kitasatospora sp. NPDC017646]|uniref:hypothetical protein n=1 Tax=Kitasatospora sp. NPDC017646 TaxID=3364024 RepID=UPI0037B5756F